MKCANEFKIISNSLNPANNGWSSGKCPVNFSFWPAKAWSGWTLWLCMTICLMLVQNFFSCLSGNKRQHWRLLAILISHLSGCETSGLKISCIHWRGSVLWTERASLKSFVHKKNKKMCPNVSIDHSLWNLISSYCFEFFVQPHWVLVQSKLALAWQMTFL